MVPPYEVSSASEKPNEFKRYRQVLAALYMGTVAAGFILLATSVVKQLFFRPVVKLDGPVLSATNPDPADLMRCNRDVLDLYNALGDEVSHLLSVPRDGERGDLGRRWESFSREWLREWDEVNAFCRFEELSDSGMDPHYNRMARVHGDLRAMRLKYQSLLVRFDDEQAAELARMRQALDKSRLQIDELRTQQDGGRTQ